MYNALYWVVLILLLLVLLHWVTMKLIDTRRRSQRHALETFGLRQREGAEPDTDRVREESPVTQRVRTW